MSLITSYFGDKLHSLPKVNLQHSIPQPSFRVQKKVTSKSTSKRTTTSLKDTKKPIRTDIILPMQEPYMQQIVDGIKNYEFRRYLIAHSVQRIWFYRTAPYSTLDYICEIQPARTRNTGDEPLTEDGEGNMEFNTRHKDWDGYDYAYKIDSVYRLKEPISLANLNLIYGIKSAPRGLVYTPANLMAKVDWKEQEKLR